MGIPLCCLALHRDFLQSACISLRERIKYAAFVAIFFSLWRNWIVISNAFSLNQNFLTRECFQDVLLSCHFVVILISYFRDEHPDLECPLHLTGSDCCERYFSENSSFVQNRHNYTFLDIHTNLGHINRVEEIKATNPDIKIPIRKHNNTNEQGDETSDDDKWFYKPMEYVDFKKSLRGMETEQETLRREAREQQSEEATETETGPNSDGLCDSFEDEEVGDIHQIVNPLLDSFNTNKEAEKRSATLLIPGVGRRYKSTIIAELRNNPELSTDRLRRVRGAGTSSESEKTGDNDSTDSGDSVALFDDCAFYDPTCAGKFILGSATDAQKGKNGFIEYVLPVDLGNKPANVEVIVSKYCRTSEENNSSLYNHQETVVSMPLTSLICKGSLEINQEDDIYELSAKDICIVTEFLKSVKIQQRASVAPRRINARSVAIDLEDEGRRVDTVPTSRGRLSRRVSCVTF